MVDYVIICIVCSISVSQSSMRFNPSVSDIAFSRDAITRINTTLSTRQALRHLQAFLQIAAQSFESEVVLSSLGRSR